MVNIQKIVEAYVDAAIENGEAGNNNDHKRANRCYKKMNDCYQKLKNEGADNLVLNLAPLLRHTDDNVVLWSAMHLLPYKAAEAEEALNKICQGQGLLAFDAEMTLKEWRAGRLKP